MINSIKISNFKAFGEMVEIPFNKLTILSGLNGSGKSTIYQVLLMLQESENCMIKVKGSYIPYLKLNSKSYELGKTEEILNDKSNNIIKFELNTDSFNKIIHYEYIPKLASSSGSTLILKYLKVKLKTGSYYELNRTDNFEWDLKAHHILTFDLPKIGEELYKYFKKEFGGEFLKSTVEFKKIRRVQFFDLLFEQITVPFEDIEKCIKDDLQSQFDINQFKSELEKMNVNIKSLTLLNGARLEPLEQSFKFNKIMFIQPFRGYPKRIYRIGTDVEPIKSLDYFTDIKYIYRYDFTNNKRITGTLEEAIKYWLIKFFKLADDIMISEPVKDLITEIFLIKNNKKIPMNNLGFGISQIIPIIYNILIEKKGLIIVDEPEIHLHPKLQSMLGDFFFQMSLIKGNIIVETHSEYLIEKIIYLQLKYNKKTKINQFWVESKGNHSIISKIKFDELGYILNTPDDFLNENRNLIEDLSKLRLEKIDE